MILQVPIPQVSPPPDQGAKTAITLIVEVGIVGVGVPRVPYYLISQHFTNIVQ